MARAKATEAKKQTNEKQPAAEWVQLASLAPWKNNPRKNERALPGVMASLRKFGWGRTLVARRETREVVIGHTTLAAALALGWTEGPCRFVDLDETQSHALAVADNKTAEASLWDDGKLALVFAEVKAVDVDALVATGFASVDIDAIVAKMAPTPAHIHVPFDDSDPDAARGGTGGGYSSGREEPRDSALAPAPPQPPGVSVQDEIEEGINHGAAAALGGSSEFVDGWINFAVRLMPDQDETVMAAIRSAKHTYKVTTSGNALVAICRAFLGDTGNDTSERNKTD